jgi:prepilin-type N-terminal cleavage/methylation domain-containing protein/prepilin-type processing-associated H-X9-DG protein
MKPRFSNQRNQAMTLVEVLVVLVVLAILFPLIYSGATVNNKKKAQQIYCASNLKQIAIAYKAWPGGQSDKYPMQVSVTNGGAMELAATGNVAAIFQVMSNELSTPKILICPADTDRIAATNFTTGFNNTKISYFVGLDADDGHLQTLLSGDDNFEISGVSVKSGLLELSTSTQISWTAERHKFTGNIGFADGSVIWQTTSSSLRELLQHTGNATNRLAIP